MKLQSLFNKVAAALTILGVFSTTAFLLYILLTKVWIWAPLLIMASPALFLFFMVYKNTSLKGPVDFIFDRSFLFLYNFFFYKRVYIWDFIYNCLGYFLPSTEWKHINWGFAALNENGHLIDLRPEDEDERFCTQYAHYTGTELGTLKTLEGKTVLEVSSGRGGGLSYYSRYLNPKKCIGVDLAEVQIAFCKRTYARDPKLVFYQGNAQALSEIKELKGEKIDVVVSIDSGHCYPNFKKFIQEVRDVLHPTGVFCYSDFRPVEDWAQTLKDIESCFVIKKQADITQNAIQSLKLDEPRKLKLLSGRVNPFWKFFFKKMGGVRGSLGWEGLNSGRHTAKSFVLQKI